MKQPSLNSPVFSRKSAKPLETLPSVLALHKKVHVCMCVCVQSVLWLCAPMDEWLDSLSVSQTTRVRIPLNAPFFLSSFSFLSRFIGSGGHMRNRTSDLGVSVLM